MTLLFQKHGFRYWFLRSAAPFLYQPVAFLCNQSISFSFIPPQWKSSIITPVPKTNQPTDCADFRPISVTSILCRLVEKLVIRKFFYPILTHANFKNLFNDQFAFRPSGSTTAALINLLQKISLLLEERKYMHLIELDFSKAFDSVCHSTLIEKIAPFPIPSNVHNWLVEYLNSRQHCTKYNSVISTMLQINASFVQGSRMGPIAYVLNTSDLHPVSLKTVSTSMQMILIWWCQPQIRTPSISRCGMCQIGLNPITSGSLPQNRLSSLFIDLG